jgi:hypothetical protein
MPGPPINPLYFGAELLFTLISVVFCFAIFFKTKEMYDLTKYKGISYFRQAFLLFGLSYVLRFIFSLILFSRIAFDVFLPIRDLMLFFILPLGYFSTAAILLLIFSLEWKRVDNTRTLILGHAIAVAVPIIAFLTRSHMLLTYLQGILLITFLLVLYLQHRKEKKLTKTRVLYILVLILWLINLLVLDTRRPMPIEFEVIFQAASLVVFFVIYYRISKWLQ